MNQPPQNVQAEPSGDVPRDTKTSVCVDWYSEGQSRMVEVNGVTIVVRFVDKRGRRGRIAITAPAGAVFRASDVDRSYDN
jgi:hypothetical protein